MIFKIKVRKLLFSICLAVVVLIAGNVMHASADVIVDNGDTGTSFTGNWRPSSGANPYGSTSGSLTIMTPGATYTFETPIAGGYYTVSLWWTYYASRCTSVPVDIYDGSNLLATVEVNQQENGGQWNTIGSYLFQTGTASVVIRSTSSTCSTCADAVSFNTSTPTSEVIIDNGALGTESTGTWGPSSGANPYGSTSGSLTTMTPGATYTFETPIAGGYYTVSLWWTYYASRCTSVPVDIYDGSNLLATVEVNQQENGGQWNTIGSYLFQTGTASVVIRSTSSTCSTCADAVRFTLVEAPTLVSVPNVVGLVQDVANGRSLMLT